MGSGKTGNRGLSPIIVAGEAMIEAPDGSGLTAEEEAQLWAEAQPLFDQMKQSSEEINAMWMPSLPSASLLAGAAVAVVAASPVRADNVYALGVCRTASPAIGAEIRPTYDGDTYMYEYRADDPRYYKDFSFDVGAKVTLIKAPKHGEVTLVDTPLGRANNWYHYMPMDEGYSGRDRFEMQVEKNGIKIRIYYLMEVIDELDTPTGRCQFGHKKISSTFTTPTLDNLALQSLLDATGINNSVTVTTADLSGSAVGQTTGSSITLDANAAGYGWYMA